MTERHELTFDGPESGRYEIRLRGHLDARWAAWFDGLTVTRDNHGTTVIGGPIADQAALFTSTDAIEAAADAGHVALVDLGPWRGDRRSRDARQLSGGMTAAEERAKIMPVTAIADGWRRRRGTPR